ncbi:MAG: hypothetical protein KXJ51_09555, partial [Sediminibacterium sp.]|nr:hypothetical protein [Sediminibacterium sp.]
MTAWGMGRRLPSFGLGNEEGIFHNYGMADGLISLSSNVFGLCIRAGFEAQSSKFARQSACRKTRVSG